MPVPFWSSREDLKQVGPEKEKRSLIFFLALSPIIFQGSYSFLRESWIIFGIYRNCIFTIKTQGYDSCNMFWTETQLSRVCPKINTSPIALIQEKVILVNWATFKPFTSCNWELTAHFMRLCPHFTYYSHFQFWKFPFSFGKSGLCKPCRCLKQTTCRTKKSTIKGCLLSKTQTIQGTCIAHVEIIRHLTNKHLCINPWPTSFKTSAAAWLPRIRNLMWSRFTASRCKISLH